jgi:hypothetical protein
MPPTTRSRQTGNSGYNVYVSEQFKLIKSEFPSHKPPKIFSEIAKSWKSLSDEQRMNYNNSVTNSDTSDDKKKVLAEKKRKTTKTKNARKEDSMKNFDELKQNLSMMPNDIIREIKSKVKGVISKKKRNDLQRLSDDSAARTYFDKVEDMEEKDRIAYLSKQRSPVQRMIFKKQFEDWLNEGNLKEKGEKDMIQFFSDWLRGGDIVAYYYLEAEGRKLCEILRQKQLSVSPKQIVEHLKSKYKHLRGGRFHRMTKLEKETADKFWEKLRKDPLARADITTFNTFKTAIQDGIDHFFYQNSTSFVNVCNNIINGYDD